MIRQNIQYNDNLEWRQFLASSEQTAFSNTQVLGIMIGQPGMCFASVLAPNAEDVKCGVAKALLEKCLKCNLVQSVGAIDIVAHMSMRSMNYDERIIDLVQSTTNVGNALCDVMVHVNCPFQHRYNRDAQILADKACLTYFAAARDAGYNYGFFLVSL